MMAHWYRMLHKPRGGYMIAVVGDAALRAVMPIATAFVLKGAIDASVDADSGTLWRSVAMFASSVILFASLSPWFVYQLKSRAKRTTANVRFRLFRHLMEKPLAYFELKHSSELLSRLTNDVHYMEEMYTEHARHFIFFLIVGAGSLFGMFMLDWRFAVALMALSLLLAVLNLGFIKLMEAICDKLQQTTGELSRDFSNLLSGIATVKMYQLESIAESSFAKTNDRIRSDLTLFGHRAALLEGMNYLLTFVSFGGIVITGAYLVVNRSIEIGTLIALIQLQMNVTFVILSISGLLTAMQSAAAGYRRVDELMKPEQTTEQQTSSSREQTSETTMVEQSDIVIAMNGIYFGYSDCNQVLKGLTMHIERGRTTAIIGASGSGKSTICKLLLGFYPIERGAILIEGQSIERYSQNELRQLIAYIPQEPYLFDMTIEDNIRFGYPDASMEQVIAAADAADIHTFIESLPDGYSTMIRNNGANLSGGQKQRITIARAILKDAPILLMDEPTSALDPESERAVTMSLERLRLNRTVIIIAHRPITIEKADVIFSVYEGRANIHDCGKSVWRT